MERLRRPREKRSEKKGAKTQKAVRSSSCRYWRCKAGCCRDTSFCHNAHRERTSAGRGNGNLTTVETHTHCYHAHDFSYRNKVRAGVVYVHIPFHLKTMQFGLSLMPCCKGSEYEQLHFSCLSFLFTLQMG